MKLSVSHVSSPLPSAIGIVRKKRKVDNFAYYLEQTLFFLFLCFYVCIIILSARYYNKEEVDYAMLYLQTV